MRRREIIASGALFNKEVVEVLGNRIAGRNSSTFRIRNDLDHDVVIECIKRLRHARKRTVKPGEYYSVEIYPYPWTEWWCYLQLNPDSDKVIKFLVHKGHEESHTYELRNDGIYKMRLDGCNRYFFMDWPQTSFDS